MNKKSGHWQNTGLAKWISDNLYQYNTSDEKSMNPMKWYSIQNGGNLSDTRETINGFPCRLILINDGETPLNEGQNEPTPGNVKDMGIFNFNNDKGNTDTFGLDNSIFPRCVSYEVVANSDTSAGAFVPYNHTYSIATGSKNITANLTLTNAIPFSNLPEFPWTITSFTREIQLFKIDGSIPSTIITIKQGETKTVEQLGSNTIVFRTGSGDTGAIAKFSINNNIYEIDRTGTDTNILQKTTEADELAYLQDSFELRYPDDKEVGADYGMLGMTVDKPAVDYWMNNGSHYTTLLPVDIFGGSITVDTLDSRKGVYIDFFNSDLAVVSNVYDWTGTTHEIPSNIAYLSVMFIYDNAISLNGKVYVKGNLVEGTKVIKEPYSVPAFDSNYGLKRVVDFVGNSTDEEFVANFEQYFNKEYTFRYYLLVITLG